MAMTGSTLVDLNAGNAKATIARIAALFADNMSPETDPAIRYATISQYKLNNSQTPSRQQGLDFWTSLLESDLKTNPVLWQSNDFGAVSVWYSPSNPRPPRDPATVSRATLEFDQQTSEQKKTFIRGRPYWHCHLLVKDAARSTPGAVSAVMRPQLEMAKQEKAPVWIEATNEHARDVYLHYGFKVVGEVVQGRGLANGRGFLEEGGPGVVIWSMILEP